MNPIEEVSHAEKEGFEPITTWKEIPDRPIAESKFWSQILLSSECNPYHQGRATRHSLHRATSLAPDLLRHEYDAAGEHLVVTEGRAFVVVQLPYVSMEKLGACDEERRCNVVSRIAPLLCASECPLPGGFEFPDGMCEGTTFTTNSQLDPRLMTHWAERVDGIVREDGLYVVMYKRLARIVGWLDPYSWFAPNGRMERSLRLPRRMRRLRR